MKLNCKKISELISVIDNRNKNEKYTELLGININKEFIKSVANTVGTDLTKYKVIENECFACNLMHVGRDKKIPMALYKGNGAIVSPAYYVFKVKNQDEILPEYLELYFNKDEFDNKMYFLSQNGIRGNLDWKDFVNEVIYYPSLDIQKKVVKTLEIINKNILTNNKIANNLMETIEYIYDKNFNDFERFEIAENIADITIGKTPPRSNRECFSKEEKDIKWVSISDLGKSGVFINNTSERLTKEAVEQYNVKIIPEETVILSFKLTVGRVAITRDIMATNEAIAHFNLKDNNMNHFIYCYLKKFDFASLGSTSSIAIAVNSKIIKGMPIGIPNQEQLEKFNNEVNGLFSYIKDIENENEILIQLKNNLLPKILSGEIDFENITL